MKADDPDMFHKAAPKPSMKDDFFNNEWWNQTTDERYAKMHDFEFCIKNTEPAFDAADIMRCGKDLFMQLSMTCNKAGIEWLRKELYPHGFRVHMVRFPYDLAPSHLDCSFVPLRPGLVLTNPERPIYEEDAKLFKDNGWRFVDAPLPKNPIRPWASQSSKWLSMNVLSIGPETVVVEEQETPMHELLESEGFEVVKVPFRDVYEFGGGLHCATWDLTRDDAQDDFFPKQ
jgi:glycine amidinotransferase